MAIVRQHKPKPLLAVKNFNRPITVTKKQKVANAAKAAVRIVKQAAQGGPIFVEEQEKQRRLAICRGCEYWNEGGNVGLGECKHPGCGCTRFKQGLATESCPIDKW